MRVTILTDRARFNYHVAYAEAMESVLTKQGFTVTVMEAYGEDMTFNVIADTMASYIISLDVAGFMFPTYTGTCALASLSDVKFLCMVWGDNEPRYDPALKFILSLGMRFYDLTGRDWGWKDKPEYETVYYYKPWQEFPRPGKYTNPDALRPRVTELFPALWQDFLDHVCYEEDRMLLERNTLWRGAA